MKVLVSEQILVRLRSLHPDHRRDIRAALRELAKGNGEVKQLEGSAPPQRRRTRPTPGEPIPR